MEKILYCDEDPDFIEALTGSLRAFGFELEAIPDPKKVPARLMAGGCTAVVCGMLQRSQDPIHFCRDLRAHPDPRVHAAAILLAGPDELDEAGYRELVRLRVSFLNQYSPAGKWAERLRRLETGSRGAGPGGPS